MYHTDLSGRLCYGLLPGKKGRWVSLFRQDDGWQTKDKDGLDSTLCWWREFLDKKPCSAVSLSCLLSLLGFPHKDLLSTNWIIFYCYVTPQHCSLRHSSRALNPKCKDSNHHTVRWRTSGSSSPVWFERTSILHLLLARAQPVDDFL